MRRQFTALNRAIQNGIFGSLIVMMIFAFSPTIAQAEAPDAVVRDIFAQVLSQLDAKKSAGELNPTEVRVIFAELLNPRIDYISLARWILRERWRDASTDQQSAFLAAFQAYIINTYALALANGQEITLDVEPDPVLRKNAAIVRANFAIADSDAVPLEFRLIERDAQWNLFDVSFAGVSLALTFRSDFNYVANEGGIDAVTRHLEQRVSSSPP